MFTREPRKMEKADLQGENFISKMIPDFLKIRKLKEIVQLVVDDQRNMLYSLGISANDKTRG